MDHLQIILNLKQLQASIPSQKAARLATLSHPTPRQVTLRAGIPTAILGHFDRMVAQGRVGIAPLRNGVCGGCHIKMPRALVAGIKGAHELDVCDQCGAFIFSEELLSEASQPATAVAK